MTARKDGKRKHYGAGDSHAPITWGDVRNVESDLQATHGLKSRIVGRFVYLGYEIICHGRKVGAEGAYETAYQAKVTLPSNSDKSMPQVVFGLLYDIYMQAERERALYREGVGLSDSDWLETLPNPPHPNE